MPTVYNDTKLFVRVIEFIRWILFKVPIMENAVGDLSSNRGQDYLHFMYPWEMYESNILPPAMGKK